MTNGRSGGGSGMASFMTKKKKYRFQVEVLVEELLEVPFVSAVLFAKLRLLDGGNFQTHTKREEVVDHTVKWNTRFSFQCKMLAPASTGVLEPCVLRISVRKECKGGRSFTKLGFVDLNLAEFAGAGETSRKALLEGYDTRRRQDNSMLKFSIKMNMLAGDVLFKVPSPSLKHKPVTSEECLPDPVLPDEFSAGSLAGSIASASSGFGSLPKKRPPLLTSELTIGQTLSENSVPVSIATDNSGDVVMALKEPEECLNEPGHSRNSSNTSQMSKASGYSSIHSHSRHSSSGDSGHIRNLHMPKWLASHKSSNLSPSSPSFPMFYIQRQMIWKKKTFSVDSGFELYTTPEGDASINNNDASVTENSSDSGNCSDLYYTPDSTMDSDEVFKTADIKFVSSDVFSNSFSKAKTNELQKSCSCTTVEMRVKSMSPIKEVPDHHLSDNGNGLDRLSLNSSGFSDKQGGVLRSKSDFEIPKHDHSPTARREGIFQSLMHKSENFISYVTPRGSRKISSNGISDKIGNQSTPVQQGGGNNNNNVKMNVSPVSKFPAHSEPCTRTASPTSSIRSRITFAEGQPVNGIRGRGLSHRKILEGGSGGKLAPVANSPDEAPFVSSDSSLNPQVRRPSITKNHSSGSLVLSETGSLDRAKAALERRKKAQNQDTELATVSGRVEGTRVNPDHLIAELLKNTNLEQTDDSAESSGLQLFIAKDGTAALGNHEVKSQMSTGAQLFKQVVMEDKR
ncbi:uncharacterized protein LOC108743429 isoform X1 [Agrilus planipennis]|uniref:Uncharacterized protein LOC108743429 isoform X1 n=1 Tax=Agrilus planipennis TaxID=224129 RepID=A0A1W4XQ22_AGRPL|nr:uncharacterized protein LOC108743429 isoform X1 [Agrilus planipennis]